MSRPFLLFDAGDLARLQAARESTHATLFAQLETWGEAFKRFAPLESGALPDHRDPMQVYYENAAAYIVNMSLLYRLTDEPSYLEAARKWLLAFASYPSETDGGYFIGSYAMGLGAGYDMLHSDLTSAERERVRDHLIAVLQRGRKGVHDDWWAGIRIHHDHWLPVAGLVVGAAALHGEVAEADAWRTEFLDHLRMAVRTVGEDGAWPEGAADWVYAMSMTFICFDVIQRLTGENLFELPMVRGGLDYRLYSLLPDGTYVYLHDSFRHGRYNVMGSASGHVLRKLAAELQDGRAQWLALHDDERDLAALAEEPRQDWRLDKKDLYPPLHAVGWNYLWYDPYVFSDPPGGYAPLHAVAWNYLRYDPSVAPASPDPLPLYRMFSNQGLLLARSEWGAGDSVFTFSSGPLGGHRAREEVLAGDRRLTSNISHTHLLAGDFTLYGAGSYLAVPPGYGARGGGLHNTLTIEGAVQRRDPAHNAQIIAWDAGDDWVYAQGDYGETYEEEAGLARARRHIVFLAPDTVVIYDELALVEPRAAERTTTWHLNYDHTTHGPDFRDAQQSVMIAPINGQEGGALAVRFLNARPLILESRILRPENAHWAWCGQVTASRTDLFADSAEAHLLAVLSVLEDADGVAPEPRRIDVPDAVGAQVGGRVVLFARSGETVRADVAVTTASEEVTWNVFGLEPDAEYSVELSRAEEADGRVRHALSLAPGSGLRANENGSLVINSGLTGGAGG